MFNELLIFFLGLVLGIITTILFLLYLLRVKCPKCKKKKPLREIITFSSPDYWEIKGANCNACEQAKKQKSEQIEIF